MTTKTFTVPDELNVDQLIVAMENAPPLPDEWPEGVKFLPALECQALAGVIIDRLHPHLTRASIAYVFREEIAGRGRVVLAKASKPGGAFAFITGLDFLMTVNFEAWKDLEHAARCALVDHELSHFDKDLETGNYCLVGHDLEEFHHIVRRWGFWKPDLVSFAEIVKVQLELFGGKTDG